MPEVFNHSRPVTLLESTSESSILYDKHEPGIWASLNEAYVTLIEMPLESGDLLVRFLYRPETSESILNCRQMRLAISRKECATQLTSLAVLRDGTFLILARPDSWNSWARLKFLTYESTFMSSYDLAVA